MDDTALDLGPGKDRMDRLAKAGQAVHTDDEDVLNAPILQICDYIEPEISPFSTVGHPMSENIPVTFQINPQDNMHCRVGYLPIPSQFDVDGIQKDDRIDGCQRPVLPGFHQLPDFVGDLADRAGGNIYTIQLPQRILDISSGNSLSVQTQDLFFQLVGISAVFGNDLGFEFAIPVSGNLDFNIPI